MKSNKAEFTYGELLVLFGENTNYKTDLKTVYRGVSTDTRTIEEGNIFVAIKGENFDANTKTDEAFEKGAAVAIIDEQYYNRNKNKLAGYNIFPVQNTLKALGDLARYHRNRFDIHIIAVGGSNGKTTTKEMIAAVLSKQFNILKTEGNYNNQIGVPLTLLQLNDTFDAAVIEIGTNEPGEIALLTSIVNPTAGLITNIGREHLEKLINRDGVEMEETFLFGYLQKHDGTVLLNIDDDRLKKYKPFLDKNIPYGTDEDAEIFAQIKFNDKLQPLITIEDKSIMSDIESPFEVSLQVIGYAAAQNAIAAIATGIYLKIPPEKIVDALKNYRQDESKDYARMALQKIANISILNDCYNANPDSMRIALLTLKEMPTEGKKIAVLGDMRELGDASYDEHIALLNEAAQSYDNIYVIGKEMEKAAKDIKASNIKTFETHQAIAQTLKSSLSDGDVILVKGSRGMEMERIIKYLSDNL